MSSNPDKLHVWCADLSDEENGARAITAVVELSKKVGTAQSIQQMGGDEATIAEAVQQALTGEYRSSFSEVVSCGGAIELQNHPWPARPTTMHLRATWLTDTWR